MKILDLYIARILISTSALCLLILTGLSGIIKWVDQLRVVGRGAYTVLDAGIYVLFLVPRDIELFFPMAVLLGGLIGLGMLASNSELVIMQASGLSRLQITFSVMKTAVPLMLLVMALSEWGAPVAEKKAYELRASRISSGSLIKSRQGVWAKDGEFFVNIGQVNSINRLSNITLYSFDERHKLRHMIFAKSADFISGTWKMHQVTQTHLTDSKITDSKLIEYDWQSTLTPDKLSVVSAKPESLSIQGLIDYLDYLKINRQDASQYQLALWRKIMQPFTVAVMLLVALSFIFGPLRTVTMGARVLMGVIAGFSFHICNQIFGPLSLVYELSPIVGAAAPSLLFAMIAIYLIRR
ncbi:LPS export ABC transporter permease LptG [Parashewanella spongiae]|uniref:LPS export ABC transporter permease LptG n=1 Tax=Parashewanella spongiae TaxID=342950 RepID=UPI0010597746|nr:LPS export ABC transporter permease LptG [Parashewanella spongiae]MCL1079762.1 LPS export ABC transporter permease LptG [Parashewanella spongiae]